MAFNLEGSTSLIFSVLGSFLFWGLLVLIVVVVVFGSLIIRKRRKFIYPVIELTDLGSGKIGFRTTVGGWFKSNSVFLNLIDLSGEEILKLKDGRQVQGASSEDFHDINGKRGLVVCRKPDDPKILLPIDKMDIKNKELMLNIAPADFRDASVNILNRSEKETIAKWEKIMPYVAIGFIMIIMFISIILIVQMVKSSQLEANRHLMEAMKLAVEAKTHLVAPSGAP